jgi:hypothetical protein
VALAEARKVINRPETKPEHIVCGITINQIGRIAPSPTGAIPLPARQYGRSIGKAATAAPNKIQFN